jgi:hypothetical protein
MAHFPRCSNSVTKDICRQLHLTLDFGWWPVASISRHQRFGRFGRRSGRGANTRNRWLSTQNNGWTPVKSTRLTAQKSVDFRLD